MTDSVRIVVVDDQRTIREGLIMIINAFIDLELVGEARNGYEAIELCRQIQPDIVLMDLMLPEVNGVEATRQIRAACPTTQVIVLTGTDDPVLIDEALQAGAAAFLSKVTSVENMVGAIRRLAAHRTT